MSQLRNFCGRVFGLKQRKFVFAAVLSSGMLFANVQSADADGGSWGGSFGSGGSRGGSHGSSGGLSRGGSLGSSGGLSRGGFLGGSGPIRNLLGRIGSRHSGGSGGSLGSLGSTGSAYSHASGGSLGGSTGYGFGSSGASYGSVGSGYLGSLDGYSADGAIYSTPQETSFSSPVYDQDGGVQGASPSGIYVEPSNGIPAAGADANNPPTPPGLPGPEADDSTSITRPASHQAVLKLVVPRDAVVFINDKRTTTPGETRSYVSRNLKADSEYHYNVKAVITRDGKEVVRSQVVTIATGESKMVAMDFDSAPMTSLALNVPVDATVKLCGKETATSGATRHYVTSKLDEGMTWKNYTVEVSVVRDGKVLTQERTMNLLAGEIYSLDFDFDAAAGQIVSR